MSTLETAASDDVSATRQHRFRLNRAGILNVWQYDDQLFDFADGRLLLRGANGAGKSKTLEMLLPFVLDGDKARMTASARHHTSLLWLMTDGYDGQARVGYLWVEFARTAETGREEFLTCGVGIRASTTAKTATAWFFTTPARVGRDLRLEDEAGPLSRPRLVEALAGSGQVFDQARAYKEHVGRILFGLDVEQYDEVLRLLYWLRQPQIGEDIEPARLAGQLLQALPQLDDQAVRTAGDTFDELAAVGEQLDRRSAAAAALIALRETYVAYARAVSAELAEGLLGAHRHASHRRGDLRKAVEQYDEIQAERRDLEEATQALQGALEEDEARLRRLHESPEARSQQRLMDLASRASELEHAAATAEDAYVTSEERWRARQQRLATDRDEIIEQVRSHGDRTRSVNQELAQVALGASLASTLGETALSEVDDQAAARLASKLDAFPELVDAARRQVGERQATVSVVREALAAVTTAVQRSDNEDLRAAEAETRWERALAAVAEAKHSAEELVTALWSQLHAWVAEPAAPHWVLPETLDAKALEGLAVEASAAAQPVLDGLRESQHLAALDRDRALQAIAELTRRSGEIEAETDPAPPPSPLLRTPRPDGEPLWRLVDFAEHLDSAERAGLEAALQASSLLDAWVRPDGRLLDAEHLDTLVAPGKPVAGPHLAEFLIADLPEGCDIDPAVLTGVLRQVAVQGAQREEPRSYASVGTDGAWSLGPLQGRASKAKAQYVGTTARADERQRRLREVLADLDEARARHSRAVSQVDDLAGRIGAVERWVHGLPAVQPVLRSWATLDERTDAAARDEAEHLDAHERAQEARREAARLRRELERLAAQHEIPADESGIAALSERLAALSASLTELAAAVPALRRDIQRWRQELMVVSAEAAHVESLRTVARQAADHARRARAELDELQAAVGADVEALRARLTTLQQAIVNADETLRGQTARLRTLDEAQGAARQAVRSAEERQGEAEEALLSAARRFAELVDVPGLLLATTADASTLDTTALRVSRSLVPGDSLPSGLIAVARTLAASGGGDVTGCFNQVYRAHAEAATGPAADHEPRLIPVGELLSLVGRDDGGEYSITLLASRVTAAVERDRGLLTQRERDQFEQHILGELGDAIRRRRLEAEELVVAMNRLLGSVSTSQGIRVKLDWRLRDDVPSEARDAVHLLTQPTGALLPEERAALRDSLHRLIEVSRAEQPELSYSEHLAAALDYRRWFAFRIRYTRPEAEGRWLDLHRRSPLSQGEQKVLCYLPLFAAAAAHFSSLAGAAPHAPRLVLLDDAFPKIDIRTHPLLFGLLVQLDLDFVITSERLWGDHDTLPSLAIYEALRDPAQRGIAQFEFRWDGRTLRAMQ